MLRQIVSRSFPIAAAGSAAWPEKLAAPFAASEKILRSSPYFHVSDRGFLDLHKIINKEAIEKEKARLSDELNRGYFDDISEMRKNGGKIALANKIMIPEISAVKFPELEVNCADCTTLQLPIIAQDKISDASLMCLSFRASSQKMIESWSLPFLDKFGTDGKIQVYEVSFVDSRVLSFGPVKKYFLKTMKKSNNPLRQNLYAFGDHYDFRKKLQIINLLTGYIFLLDRLGRIRWQGFGSATEEELDSLFSCTSILLNDK